MKYSELHRLIRQNGWKVVRQTGSHIRYEKDGKAETVPFHGSKEVHFGLAIVTIRKMKLK
jgi:predicted RNA binding protein YcfA (HicA-like mRNA interferase family)